MSTDTIHRLLAEKGIKHLCHFGSPYTTSDLSMARITCAECLILNGDVSLEDVLTGKVDLCDVRKLCDYHDYVYFRRAGNINKLRRDGLIPAHTVEKVIGVDGVYDRYTCHLKGGDSGPVPDDKICKSCKKPIEMPIEI